MSISSKYDSCLGSLTSFWPVADRKSATSGAGTKDKISLPASSVSVIFPVVVMPTIQQPETVHNGHRIHKEQSLFPISWNAFLVSFGKSTTGFAAVRDAEDANLAVPL